MIILYVFFLVGDINSDGGDDGGSGCGECCICIVSVGDINSDGSGDDDGGSGGGGVAMIIMTYIMLAAYKKVFEYVWVSFSTLGLTVFHTRILCFMLL